MKLKEKVEFLINELETTEITTVKFSTINEKFYIFSLIAFTLVEIVGS